MKTNYTYPNTPKAGKADKGCTLNGCGMFNFVS